MEVFKKELILSKIEELKLQGFDQIKIPGGSSKDEAHYAGVFVCKYDKDSKQFFFLGVPYNSSFWKKNESNGHTKKFGESPTETARREVYEETGLLVNEIDLDFIWTTSFPSRKDKTKKHTKFVYLTTKYNGTLSDFGVESNPIDGETSTPLWIPARLFKQILYKGHQEPFMKAVDFLSQISADYYYALCNL